MFILLERFRPYEVSRPPNEHEIKSSRFSDLSYFSFPHFPIPYHYPSRVANDNRAKFFYISSLIRFDHLPKIEEVRSRTSQPRTSFHSSLEGVFFGGIRPCDTYGQRKNTTSRIHSLQTQLDKEQLYLQPNAFKANISYKFFTPSFIPDN